MPYGEKEGEYNWTKWVISGAVLLALITIGGLWGCPQYSVYSQRMAGEAEYAQALYNRKVKTLESITAESSAIHNAAADTIRAQGVARSNQIIGTSLRNNEAYLTWLYIEGMKENKNASIIYVPTEANLPILEAGRFGKMTPKDTSTK